MSKISVPKRAVLRLWNSLGTQSCPPGLPPESPYHIFTHPKAHRIVKGLPRHANVGVKSRFVIHGPRHSFSPSTTPLPLLTAEEEQAEYDQCMGNLPSLVHKSGIYLIKLLQAPMSPDEVEGTLKINLAHLMKMKPPRDHRNILLFKRYMECLPCLLEKAGIDFSRLMEVWPSLALRSAGRDIVEHNVVFWVNQHLNHGGDMSILEYISWAMKGFENFNVLLPTLIPPVPSTRTLLEMCDFHNWNHLNHKKNFGLQIFRPKGWTDLLVVECWCPVKEFNKHTEEFNKHTEEFNKHTEEFNKHTEEYFDGVFVFFGFDNRNNESILVM